MICLARASPIFGNFSRSLALTVLTLISLEATAGAATFTGDVAGAVVAVAGFASTFGATVATGAVRAAAGAPTFCMESGASTGLAGTSAGLAAGVVVAAVAGACEVDGFTSCAKADVPSARTRATAVIVVFI